MIGSHATAGASAKTVVTPKRLPLFYPSVFHALLEEFWGTVDPKATDIEDRLAEWQHFWNWDRLHMALGGNTPIDHIC